MTNYEKWDKERQERYPNAIHSQWESWNDDIRVAGFCDTEWWVYKIPNDIKRVTKLEVDFKSDLKTEFK